ncbi:hypothetical protein QBC38DRAFT_540344 [Podospora fimiseda]|uniref:Uncharacterized protein n=1 Tax=Podospora fimiseda TaxID=252190 RepID=A0AAN6YRB3_9PEZI|nr:hypothetical protein QBC38DRAFT_540344 [Podospora fimiseda]
MAPAMPTLPYLVPRKFDTGVPQIEFGEQWTRPSDVFSVLLILGADIVSRALAVHAVGKNKLMPPPDSVCEVINSKSGYVRDNSSWIIGRIVRDFEKWMHEDARKSVGEIIDMRWEQEKHKAAELSAPPPPRPGRVGLCVSVYRAREARPGHPGNDWPFWTGFITSIVQLGVAAIPYGLFGNWSILMITTGGIILCFLLKTPKTVILTRGNGSQHAIMIIGDGKGLDTEDLATAHHHAGCFTTTWFLVAIGAIGICQKISAAGATRSPEDFGMHALGFC